MKEGQKIWEQITTPTEMQKLRAELNTRGIAWEDASDHVFSRTKFHIRGRYKKWIFPRRIKWEVIQGREEKWAACINLEPEEV